MRLTVGLQRSVLLYSHQLRYSALKYHCSGSYLSRASSAFTRLLGWGLPVYTAGDGALNNLSPGD